MEEDIQWNAEKDAWLRTVRQLSFQMAEEAIALDQIVDDFAHPGANRQNQRIMVFRVGGKCVAVPYIKGENARFLKTMYFARDLDKYHGGQDA